MKSLLIIGAGGHGRVVAEIAEDCGYESIAFLDDNSSDAIGKVDDIEKHIDFIDAFCAIGNNKLRKEILDRLLKAGYNVPILIHPSAYVSRTTTIGCGTVVAPIACINANSIIGKGCIVSASAVIDHNVNVGNYAHVNAGAIIKSGGIVSDFEKIDSGIVVTGY